MLLRYGYLCLFCFVLFLFFPHLSLGFFIKSVSGQFCLKLWPIFWHWNYRWPPTEYALRHVYLIFLSFPNGPISYFYFFRGGRGRRKERVKFVLSEVATRATRHALPWQRVGLDPNNAWVGGFSLPKRQREHVDQNVALMKILEI